MPAAQRRPVYSARGVRAGVALPLQVLQKELGVAFTALSSTTLTSANGARPSTMQGRQSGERRKSLGVLSGIFTRPGGRPYPNLRCCPWRLLVAWRWPSGEGCELSPEVFRLGRLPLQDYLQVPTYASRVRRVSILGKESLSRCLGVVPVRCHSRAQLCRK